MQGARLEEGYRDRYRDGPGSAQVHVQTPARTVGARFVVPCCGAADQQWARDSPSLSAPAAPECRRCRHSGRRRTIGGPADSEPPCPRRRARMQARPWAESPDGPARSGASNPRADLRSAAPGSAARRRGPRGAGLPGRPAARPSLPRRSATASGRQHAGIARRRNSPGPDSDGTPEPEPCTVTVTDVTGLTAGRPGRVAGRQRPSPPRRSATATRTGRRGRHAAAAGIAPEFARPRRTRTARASRGRASQAEPCTVTLVTAGRPESLWRPAGPALTAWILRATAGPGQPAGSRPESGLGRPLCRKRFGICGQPEEARTCIVK